jgi:hypothetical protein
MVMVRLCYVSVLLGFYTFFKAIRVLFKRVDTYVRACVRDFLSVRACVRLRGCMRVCDCVCSCMCAIVAACVRVCFFNCLVTDLVLYLFNQY